ncbi:ribosomal-protein-alanine acetyltransferase [Bacillus sp. UMTAT18]|uniref:GNAT family N-acetyltransferase n=1 Tax=Bacillus TaxID=1386 RepID=UPI0006186B09|nr:MULTISPECIES: GNAT family N-acetyltransferase [unclassified Bacillus (in: firmicutes)]KKC52775.1 ribosomal-protein-alanine acetyltransferase [Bacillus sp. UMTAT18]MDU2394143.1 GNAT family N-acetyltransferase [Bacillus sp. (in: firmicutes)]OJD76006.1 acetyltransferase [Bacillus sp. P14-1]
MPSLFKPMAFQLKTERLELCMWEESDSVWLSKLIGERGVDIPAVDSVRNRLIEMRKKADENGISLLTIRRQGEGDFIGYCGLIIGRSTLEEPEIAYELFRSAHGKGYATEAASVVLDAAIATGRHKLWSTVGAWNVASLRVLEKIGFKQHHSTWDDERGEIIWNVRDL